MGGENSIVHEVVLIARLVCENDFDFLSQIRVNRQFQRGCPVKGIAPPTPSHAQATPQ